MDSLSFFLYLFFDLSISLANIGDRSRANFVNGDWWRIGSDDKKTSSNSANSCSISFSALVILSSSSKNSSNSSRKLAPAWNENRLAK